MKIQPFLMFKNNAEEAVKFYTELLNGKIISTSYYTEKELKELERRPEDQRPASEGNVKLITFEIQGQRMIAGNGGNYFEFNHGVSLTLTCESQEELDRIWNALASDGGAIEECGWVRDRFGIPWQLWPAPLVDWLHDKDVRKVEAVSQAVYRMKKLRFDALEMAYNSGKLPTNENRV